MAASRARASWWLRWLVLPLGRLLHLLGFRLRFWWTLPVPTHPLIAWLLPFVPVALVGWASLGLVRGEAAPVSWWALLATGLLLVVPMSIPIFNVFAFAFRVPLLQGFCFLGGMVLLAAEVLSGQLPIGYGALPLAYALLFLVQRVGGPIFLARLQRDNAAFAPVAPSDALVRLSLQGRGELPFWDAQRVMRERGLAQVAVRTRSWRRRDRLYLRPTGEARELLKDLVPEGDRRSSSEGLWVGPIDTGRLRPEVDVRLHVGRTWLLDGRLSLLTVRQGGTRRRLARGKVAPVGNWPLLLLFYDFAVFSGSPNKGRWHAGFVPGRAVTLDGGGEQWMPDVAFAESEPWAEVGPDALRRTLEPLRAHFVRRAAAAERRRARERRAAAAMVDPFLASGKVPLRLFVADFTAEPELLRGKGRALCEALAAAKARRDRTAARVAATLLAAVPLNEFVALEKEMLSLLGSRILALQWQLTPDFDLTPLPRNCPKWGEIAGFGLMGQVPALWERLGELGPEAARIVARFIEEVGERPPLVAARRRLAERGIDLPPV